MLRSIPLLATVLACALSAPTTMAAPTRPVQPTILLDADAEASERLVELEALKAQAKTGDHAAVCVLGRLAFAGDRHPAELPAFDYGEAASWLNRCIVGGDLDAMLVMAELELHDRRALEAMIWMQAYLKLAATLDPESVNAAAPYKAGILARIEKLYEARRPDNDEVLEYVAGFLSSYGERIATAHRAGGWSADLPLPAQEALEMKRTGAALSGRFTRDMTSARDELVYAKYLVEVAPSGKPDRIFVVESYPDAKAARALKSYPISRRFNAVTSSASRWFYLPVYMDNKAYDLMPEAGSNYRPQEH